MQMEGVPMPLCVRRTWPIVVLILWTAFLMLAPMLAQLRTVSWPRFLGVCALLALLLAVGVRGMFSWSPSRMQSRK